MGCAGRLRQIQRSFGPRNGLHYEGSADLERVPNQELTFFLGGGGRSSLFDYVFATLQEVFGRPYDFLLVDQKFRFKLHFNLFVNFALNFNNSNYI